MLTSQGGAKCIVGRRESEEMRLCGCRRCRDGTTEFGLMVQAPVRVKSGPEELGSKKNRCVGISRTKQDLDLSLVDLPPNR